MDKISVIVPVYNVELYIKKCLDSIVNQTHSNLEILLINDGSTDNSGRICEDYAKKDSRIRLFQKDNGGLSSALNVGLENFSCNYLGFVDSDDWIEPNMFEELYKLVKQKNVSIGVANYFIAYDIASVPRKNKLKVPEGTLSKREMLEIPLKRDFYYGFSGYVWNKLWSAQLFKNNGFKFDENIKFAMDMLFYYTVLLKTDCNGVYSEKPYYHYYQRNSSISYANPERNTDALAVYQHIIDMLKETEYADLSLWAKRYYCYFATLFAEYAIESDDKINLNKMQEKIQLYLKEYISTNKEFPERIDRVNKLLKADING